jgi:hypothetical protein
MTGKAEDKIHISVSPLAKARGLPFCDIIPMLQESRNYCVPYAI